ncbi:PIG-X [Syncephalis plumigaleata]|nr:PIG-X [Syncephalis plumigaleata]
MFNSWIKSVLGTTMTEESPNKETRVGIWPVERQRVSMYALPAQSFHPVLHYNLSSLALTSSAVLRPASHCNELVLYQSLPAALFADPYQLHDVLEQGAERVHHYGQIELENPVNEASPTGVSITVWNYHVHNKVDDATAEQHVTSAWKVTDIVELPLHGRYQIPLFGGEEKHITVQPGQFYWLCQQELKQSNNHLIASKDTEIAQLFNGKYAYQVESIQVIAATSSQDAASSVSEQPQNTITITLPSGRLEDASIVALGTLACVIIGLLWLMWTIFAVRHQRGGTSDKSTGQSRRTTPVSTDRVQTKKANADAYDADVEKEE